jgi:hypothetical protein
MMSALTHLFSDPTAMGMVALAAILRIAIPAFLVLVGLFRAKREDAVKMVEAGATWLPWRRRRRSRDE